MMQSKTAKQRGQKQQLNNSALIAVFGAACLWSWCFLCYLSPALFVVDSEASVGIENGFFVSQVCTIIVAFVLVVRSRVPGKALRPSTSVVCAVVLTSTTLLLAWAVACQYVWLILLCGFVQGLCVPLLGAAWGTRFSLGSKPMRGLIVLSFLVAYLFYLLVPLLPYILRILVVALLPACSCGAFFRCLGGQAASKSIADGAHAPEMSTERRNILFEQLVNGSWALSEMPWESLVVVLIAALAGNAVASAVMGFSYNNATGMMSGGVVVCACISTIALIPLTTRNQSLSASFIYRISITLTVIGLVGIMVFGRRYIASCGALVQGCAFFSQVLIIVFTSQAVQERGISPLPAFCVAQAVTALTLLIGTFIGKQTYMHGVESIDSLELMCGAATLVLFFLLVGQAGKGSEAQLSRSEVSLLGDTKNTMVESESQLSDVADQVGGCAQGEKAFEAGETSASLYEREKLQKFAREYGLTKREVEIFEFLAKGRSLPYIADKLFVTTGTVKTHTTHIYNKLQVNSKQELIDLFEEYAA